MCEYTSIRFLNLKAGLIAGRSEKNLLVFGPDAQIFLFGEFDSGSERTLAAWIRHASRARFQGSSLRTSELNESGERVSNTWVICLQVENTSGKLELMPDVMSLRMETTLKAGSNTCRLDISAGPISLLVR